MKYFITKRLISSYLIINRMNMTSDKMLGSCDNALLLTTYPDSSFTVNRCPSKT